MKIKPSMNNLALMLENAGPLRLSFDWQLVLAFSSNTVALRYLTVDF